MKSVDQLFTDIKLLLNNNNTQSLLEDSRISAFHKKSSNLVLSQHSQSHCPHSLKEQQNNEHLVSKTQKNIQQEFRGNTQKILEETKRLIKTQKDSSKSIQVQKKKFQDAAQLLKAQSSLVKKYVKEKIHSNLFSSPRKNISQREIESIERQKQIYLSERKKQLQQERMEEDQIVNKIKRNRKYGQQSLPTIKINSLLYQEPQYVFYQHSQKQLNSTNNKIQDGKSLLEQQAQQSKSRELISWEHNKNEGIYEAIEDEINEEDYLESIKDTGLECYLLNHRRFLVTFAGFIKKMCNIECIEGLNSEKPLYFKKKELTKSKVSFEPKKFPKHNKKTVANLIQISNNHFTNPFILSNYGNFDRCELICEVVVSKRIGSSTKFHSKKCELYQNEMRYCQEESSQYKSMELMVSNPQISQIIKQMSSFFSFDKKPEEIQVVIIKGKCRTFTFERNSLQGKELYSHLCQLMAKKTLKLIYLLSNHSSDTMSGFIRETNNIFDLSNGLLPEIDKFPKELPRNQVIKIFSSLLRLRQSTKQINLANLQLSTEQLASVIYFLDSVPQLRKLKLDGNKISELNMSIILKSISMVKRSGITLSLNKCCISNEILEECLDELQLALKKIKVLDLSNNGLGIEALDALAKCVNTNEY